MRSGTTPVPPSWNTTLSHFRLQFCKHTHSILTMSIHVLYITSYRMRVCHLASCYTRSPEPNSFACLLWHVLAIWLTECRILYCEQINRHWPFTMKSTKSERHAGHVCGRTNMSAQSLHMLLMLSTWNKCGVLAPRHTHANRLTQSCNILILHPVVLSSKVRLCNTSGLYPLTQYAVCAFMTEHLWHVPNGR